ncbi:hypothetical protein ColLi_08440 [Colletotrichum liriopes]|uniref:Secreted protein n=1 Tax=Colletotrichum liriopes TaxID=708192 RepID=A0AA37LV45_9PEZI|nr:hypothetical protein ColLi_08440 [Colletotrichum liriopes]
MRVSASLLTAAVSATAALAAPVSGYKWSVSNWSGGWYGSGWANYQVTAPAATSNNVAIPAFSLTKRCSVFGKEGTSVDCSDLIANNTDGRTFKVVLGPFDNGGNVVTHATYTFKSGDR